MTDHVKSHVFSNRLMHSGFNSLINSSHLLSDVFFTTHFEQLIKTFTAKPIFHWMPSWPSWVGLSLAEVPAGYLLWCPCTAELHVLNDEYTSQWHLTR